MSGDPSATKLAWLRRYAAISGGFDLVPAAYSDFLSIQEYVLNTASVRAQVTLKLYEPCQPIHIKVSEGGAIPLMAALQTMNLASPILVSTSKGSCWNLQPGIHI